MRTHTITVEVDMEDVLTDIGRDLPSPFCPVFRGEVTVTIDGWDRQAVIRSTDNSRPAEYREATSDKWPADLAWEMWTDYEWQVGFLPLHDRDAFLLAAEGYAGRAIDKAEAEALRLDAETSD